MTGDIPFPVFSRYTDSKTTTTQSVYDLLLAADGLGLRGGTGHPITAASGVALAGDIAGPLRGVTYSGGDRRPSGPITRKESGIESSVMLIQNSIHNPYQIGTNITTFRQIVEVAEDPLT